MGTNGKPGPNEHEVAFSTGGSMTVGKAGIFVEVFKGGRRLGQLDVSKGGIAWTPAFARNPISLGWAELARLVERHGDSE